MKKSLSVFLTLMCLVFLAFPAFAAGNVQYIYGVNDAMCTAEYWARKNKKSDQILMTPTQINAYNKAVVAAKNTNRVDLLSVEKQYNATGLQSSLADAIVSEKPSGNLFIDGKEINKEAFYHELLISMRTTSWTGTRTAKYAICTTHTGIYSIPCDAIVGYSKTDPDSEFQLSELRVNEAFLIKQVCTFQNQTFYWGMSDHLSGWVNAEHLAICNSYKTWKDAFCVKTAAKDFIVVTDDSIYTEPSSTVPAISNVRLAIGTVLKLVEEENIPRNIGERNSWHNYVVYLPTRNTDGTYKREIALISQHCEVSVGYLPMTQANLLKTAFRCLGNRYGWGGTLGAMDCSLFTRAVYLCCGLNMPRNTTWQQNVPKTRFDLSKMTDAQKLKALARMPAGTLLYFPGHTMIYLGMDNNMGYVISDTGIVSAPNGALQLESTYTVIINPLSARRRDGTTWLKNLTSAVIPAEVNGHKYETTIARAALNQNGKRITACKFCGKKTESVVIPAVRKIQLAQTIFEYTGKNIYPKVSVIDSNGKTIAKSNYTVTYENNKNVGTAKVKIAFCGNYSGNLQRKFTIIPKGTQIKSVQATTNKLIVTWKKQAVQTIGYQIEYAANEKFTKSSHRIVVLEPKETVAEINLKSPRTYYLRIRTVAKSNGKTLYSAWSTATRINVQP